jgi:hypothetical protein
MHAQRGHRESGRQTLTVRLVGLGDRGRHRREEDGQPHELRRRRQQGAPSSSHCAPRGARRGSAESVQEETPTRVRRLISSAFLSWIHGDTGLAVGKCGLPKISRGRDGEQRWNETVAIGAARVSPSHCFEWLLMSQYLNL